MSLGPVRGNAVINRAKSADHFMEQFVSVIPKHKKLKAGAYRRVMQLYRKDVREGRITPETYSLVALRPLASFYSAKTRRRFVAMELLKTISPSTVETHFPHESLFELEKHMLELEGRYGMQPLQARHALFLGYAGTGKEKKAVLALPHDYR